jgi:hypothetical protein
MSGRLEQTVNLAPICRLSATALVCSRVRFLVMPQLLTRDPPFPGRRLSPREGTSPGPLYHCHAMLVSARVGNRARCGRRMTSSLLKGGTCMSPATSVRLPCLTQKLAVTP